MFSIGFVTTAVAATSDDSKAATVASAAAIKPSLSVEIITPQRIEWPEVLVANGNIAAWQEAIIGAEISNFRLTEVLLSVGDKVKKGQLMARISSDTVAAELAQSKAAVAEAEATLAEAKANADRARQLSTSNAFSAQQVTQYLAAEQTALARVTAALARMQANELQLAHTRVLAPDNGIISSSTATVGSLTQPGQELFRLIRGSRLEWRAEVTANELGKIKPGIIATLVLPDGVHVQGKVRTVGPTVDPQTRNGLVYVDLPAEHTGQSIRAGMFARGEFELSRTSALTLPQSAVVLRDGFSYVFRLDHQTGMSPEALSKTSVDPTSTLTKATLTKPTQTIPAQTTKVSQIKISAGRRLGDRIEVISGIDATTRVVASGVGFLADGDTVRIVASPQP